MSSETPVRDEAPPLALPPLPPDEPAPAPAPDAAAGLRRRAIRGGTVLIVARMLTQVFSWGVTLGVARLLAPFDYGIITTGALFVNLADLLAHAGLSRALVQKKDLDAADVAEAFTLNLLLGVTLYFLLFALAGPAALWLGAADVTDLLRVLGLALLLAPFTAMPLALLDRDLRLGRLAVVNVLSAVLQGGVVLGLALAGWGYWALAAGVLAVKVFDVIALAYVTGWRPRLRLPGARARGLLKFGAHLTAGTLLSFIYMTSDYAAVGRLEGATILGFYALAFQLVSLPVEKLSSNVNQVSYPVFCRLQHDRPRLRAWYLRVTVLLGFFSIPLLTGMILVADDGFAVVFGEKWLHSVLPFRLLSGAGLVMIFGGTVPPLLNALGRPDVVMRYNLAAALVYPASFFAAGALYGMLGVCLVWTAIYPLMFAALLYRTKPLTGVGPLALLWAQRPVLQAAAFMAVAVLLVQWALTGVEVRAVRLTAAIATGVVAYAVWMLATARGTVLADLRALLRELKGG